MRTPHFLSFPIRNKTIERIINSIAQNNQADVNPAYFTTDASGEVNLSIPFGAEQFINDVDNGNAGDISQNDITPRYVLSKPQSQLKLVYEKWQNHRQHSD